MTAAGLITDTDLQAYVDEELDPEHEALLRQSLGLCAGCQEQLERFQYVVQALHSWPLASRPPRLTRRIMAEVRTAPQMPKLRLTWVELVAGTAAAVLAYAGALLWSHLVSSSDAPQQVAAALAWLARIGLEAVHVAQGLAGNTAVASGLLSTAVAVVAAGLTAPLWYPTIREETLSLVGGGAPSH